MLCEHIEIDRNVHILKYIHIFFHRKEKNLYLFTAAFIYPDFLVDIVQVCTYKYNNFSGKHLS